MPREFHFPASVTWEGGRRTSARVEGKQAIAIAPPPEFRGTDPGLWSPEDFFTAAAASCLTVTITGLAERAGVPLRSLEVSGNGVVGKREDGHFGFVRVEQRVRLATDSGFEERARELVEEAERGCLVAVSLDLPLHTEIDIAVAAPA
ncbi:MAG: OsmC family protein [Gaiella sp.]|nr:OsmC family protein [Gaiella sp.]